jgi:hypothetical protein
LKVSCSCIIQFQCPEMQFGQHCISDLHLLIERHRENANPKAKNDLIRQISYFARNGWEDKYWCSAMKRNSDLNDERWYRIQDTRVKTRYRGHQWTWWGRDDHIIMTFFLSRW